MRGAIQDSQPLRNRISAPAPHTFTAKGGKTGGVISRQKQRESVQFQPNETKPSSGSALPSNSVPGDPSAIMWSTRSASRRLTRQQSVPEVDKIEEADPTAPDAELPTLLVPLPPPRPHKAALPHATSGNNSETDAAICSTAAEESQFREEPALQQHTKSAAVQRTQLTKAPPIKLGGRICHSHNYHVSSRVPCTATLPFKAVMSILSQPLTPCKSD